MVYFPVNPSNGPLPSSVRSMSIIHKSVNVNKYLHGLTTLAKLSGRSLGALRPAQLGMCAPGLCCAGQLYNCVLE